MTRIILLTLVVLTALVGPSPAQQSASFDLEEFALNSGGHPEGVAVVSSVGFQLRFGALGDLAGLQGLVSTSFQAGGGFVAAYPPPGEVLNVRFTDTDTLVWDPEPSTGDYNLYQGGVSTPFDAGYGACVQSGLPAETATVGSVPAAGEAIFVLVTAENLLFEEGTKGFSSGGAEHPNPAPCP